MFLSGSCLRPNTIRFAAVALLLALLSGAFVLMPRDAGAAACSFDALTNAITTANQQAPDAYETSLGVDCEYTYAGPETYTDDDGQLSAVPALTGHLILHGNGAVVARSTDQDVPAVRLFVITGSGNLELDTIAIQGFVTSTGGGGIANIGGKLTLAKSKIIDNSAMGGFGGGIVNTGSATITQTMFNGNSASFGNGLANLGGSALIDSSSFTNDVSEISPVDIYNSSSDSAPGAMTIANSTLVGIPIDQGIGIINNNVLTVMNSTIALYGENGINSQGGTEKYQADAFLLNTIVANNGTDCDASQTNVGAGIDDGGYNLSSDQSCGFSADKFSLSNVDPDFTSTGLTSMGGITFVYPLNATSPAVDAGFDVTCSGTVIESVDQLGTKRPQGAHCDIGAFEVLVPNVTAHDATATDIDSAVPLSAALALDCGDTNPNCPNDVSGTVTFRVTDADNNPAGTAVSGTVASGSAGANFDASSLAPGTYTITATYHDPNNAYGDNTDTSTLTVTPGPAASVTLSPGDADLAVGQTVIETATVRDAKNYLVADGTEVQVVVNGVNPISTTLVTSNGQVVYGYGSMFAGTDTLTMTAQSDTNPQATATITWNAPASTPRASLTIMGIGSHRVQSIVNVGRMGQPSGSFVYADRTVHLSQVHLVSLVVDGSQATLYGTARLQDGSTVSFTLDVSASRFGGTLRLQLSNGYDSGRFSAPVVRVRP